MTENLTYTGKITAVEPIKDADRIVSVTVVCGTGGKWTGIVGKDQFQVGDLCTVFLADAIVPSELYDEPCDAPPLRVRMRRFKGAPSEVFITKLQKPDSSIGDEYSQELGVIKYHKPVPRHLSGKVIGEFPSFVPKTDEPNFQAVPDMLNLLHGHPFYVSEKCDGSSTTAFHYNGHFGVCSRNWELANTPSQGYWRVAEKYNLKEKLPEGIALQWETCGPKIQKNPMGLKDIDGFAFSAYDIKGKKYLEFDDFQYLCDTIKFPMATVLKEGKHFDHFADPRSHAPLFHDNGKPREGFVIRSITNMLGHAPISFKVINLDYVKLNIY